jgi:hypothetical protein
MTAALALGLTLATSTAWAQEPGGSARQEPGSTAIAAQATFDTGYALALYMQRLAAGGSAPTQADIDEAARVYFTNGAAATGVPTTGPGAAYFKDGASVTAAPSAGAGAAWYHNGADVLTYRAVPAPPPAPPSQAPEVTPFDAGVVEAVAPVPTASAPLAAPRPAASAATPAAANSPGPTCSSQELETALAIGKEYALASPMAPLAPPPVTETVPVAEPPPRAAPAPAPVPGPPCVCASAPTLWSRVAPPLAGALLAVVGGVFWLGARAAVRHGTGRPRTG